MTTDQAIKILNGAIKKPNTIDGYLGQALTMAIEALNCSEFPNNSDTISRQAAIDALDKRFDNVPQEQTTEILLLRKDLRELPSAQPEPCKDAVSREAVSEWLKQYGQDVLHGKYKFSLMYIWKNLMALPPAQPKIGRWIKLDMHRGMADHKCTACEQECYVPTCMGEPMYAFCPNCGADMRGESDDNH